jgi:Cofactor assembly of complex C subunit B
MKANNYDVVEAGETITFQGVVQRSVSQAFFLVFCTAIGLASLALVLQIQFQDLGKFLFFFRKTVLFASCYI